MKQIKIYTVFLSAIIFIVFSGCSRIDENLPQDPVQKIHEQGILTSTSPNYHGNLLAGAQWDYPSKCMQCHGSDFNGGPEAPACKKCHTETYFHLKDNVYSKAILDNSSPFFHAKLISNTEAYSMKKCQNCHGNDYSGGKVGKTCLTCHSKTNGPEACNTCHGVPADTTGAPTTGLHNAHLSASLLSDKIACAQCHTAYASLFNFYF
ncbi:MAG: cytochrome c3 family protein [Ignavibacteriales bacterium]|nr:cytochrome c3 family protein [Ignavibacteriales bacterium]